MLYPAELRVLKGGRLIARGFETAPSEMLNFRNGVLKTDGGSGPRFVQAMDPM